MAENTQGPLSAAALREMLDQGRGAEAIARLEEDLIRVEQRVGGGSFEAARVREGLSMALIARGEVGAAIAHLQKALECVPRGDEQRKALISMQNELAMALERDGQLTLAEETLVGALHKREAFFGREHPAYGFGLSWYAEFLARRGDAKAMQVALGAFHNLQRHGHPRVADVLVLLARLQLRDGLDDPFATMDLDPPLWERIAEVMPEGAGDFAPTVVIDTALSYLSLPPDALPLDAQGRRDVARYVYRFARSIDAVELRADRDRAMAKAIESMMRAALPPGLLDRVEMLDDEPQIHLTRDASEAEQEAVSQAWGRAMTLLRAG